MTGSELSLAVGGCRAGVEAPNWSGFGSHLWSLCLLFIGVLMKFL